MKISVELNEKQANSLKAFISNVSRGQLQDLVDEGADFEVQPAIEAVVALTRALKEKV